MNKILKTIYIGLYLTIAYLLTITPLSATTLPLDIYIPVKHCDQIIKKQTYDICFSYKYNGPLYVIYELDGNLVDKNNIKKRYNFYVEPQLAKTYQIKTTVYSKTGYDRGHLANDASFDYSLTSLYETYSTANIIPMVHEINAGQNYWAGLEILERRHAKTYKKVIVVNKINYSDNNKRLKSSKQHIPISFEKHIFFNNKKECYLIWNDIYPLAPDNIDLFKIKCE